MVSGVAQHVGADTEDMLPGLSTGAMAMTVPSLLYMLPAQQVRVTIGNYLKQTFVYTRTMQSSHKKKFCKYAGTPNRA